MLIPKVSLAASGTAFKGIVYDNGTSVIYTIRRDNGSEKVTGTRSMITTKEYYPYSNESTSEIKKAIRKAQNYKTVKGVSLEQPGSVRVYVREKLPVTEAEAKAFMEKYALKEADFIKFFELYKLFAKNNPVKKLRGKI